MGALELAGREVSEAVVPESATRLICDEGTRETEWHAWSGMDAIELISVEKWIHPTARLVVVAPHPDDEILACGGLMAQHARRGGKSLVLAVSDGEASHAGQPAWQAGQLAGRRRAERLEGLSRLGCAGTEVRPLGLPDGRIANHADELESALRRELQWGDIVVTTWRLDGHPDHEACGAMTARACAAAHCRLLEAPVWMWQWGRPGDPRVPWHRLVGLPLADFAVASKREALLAHASQLAPRSKLEGPVLGQSMLERLSRRAEFFFV